MEINEVWSEWKAEKLIGEGSFGKVYKCSKTNDGETEYCAVKLISVPKSEFEIDTLRIDGMTDEQTKEYYHEIINEFISEIKLLQKLKKCPNIVHMYDYKVIERTESIGWDIFIRMELLTKFTEYISDKEIGREEVLNFGLDICNALVECEKYNIIHRDIKPENIFVYDDGIYKLGDFGTAKEFEQTLASYSMKGTYNYMSPEVFNGKKYDARADIYSLGLVMYLMMNNNRVPFIDPDKQMVKHQDRVDALSKRLKGDPMPKPKNADENLSAIILKACAFNPDDRYINARELRAALETELDNTKKRNKFQIVCSNVGYTVKRHKIISSIIAAVLTIAIIGGTAFAHRNTVATWMGIQPSTTEEDTTSAEDITGNQIDNVGFATGKCIATVGNISVVTDYKEVRIVNELTGTEESIYNGACGSVAFNGQKICFAHTVGIVPYETIEQNNGKNINPYDEIISYDISTKNTEKILQADDYYIDIIYFDSENIFYYCTEGIVKYNISTKESQFIIEKNNGADVCSKAYSDGCIYYGILLSKGQAYGCDLYLYNINSGESEKIDSAVQVDSLSVLENNLYYFQFKDISDYYSQVRLVKYSYPEKKTIPLSGYYNYDDILSFSGDYIITGWQENTYENLFYNLNMFNIKTRAKTNINIPTDININDLSKYNNGVCIMNGTIYVYYCNNEMFYLYKADRYGTLEKYKVAQIPGELSRRYTLTDNMVYSWDYLSSFTEANIYKLSDVN
jgi:serine/threonine protein kinase